MSYQGIKIAADILFKIQQASYELVQLGSKNAATKSGQQDILLAQMLNEHESIKGVKQRFTEIVDLEIK